MAAIDRIRWDDLTSVGCSPVYDMDRSQPVFYLMADGINTYTAELLEGGGFREQFSGPFALPWCGPYAPKKAGAIVKWFLKLTGAQVGDKLSIYGALIAWVEERNQVRLVGCVAPMDTVENGGSPRWFK